jgi:hypothetical protein
MNLPEAIQETSFADAAAIYLPTRTSLHSHRQSPVTPTIEHTSCDQRRLTEKRERFLLTRPQSPLLAVDLDVIQAQYRELCEHFATASIYYAVKANPAPPSLSACFS